MGFDENIETRGLRAQSCVAKLRILYRPYARCYPLARIVKRVGNCGNLVVCSGSADSWSFIHDLWIRFRLWKALASSLFRTSRLRPFTCSAAGFKVVFAPRPRCQRLGCGSASKPDASSASWRSRGTCNSMLVVESVHDLKGCAVIRRHIVTELSAKRLCQHVALWITQMLTFTVSATEATSMNSLA